MVYLVLAALYKELGEKGSQMENDEYKTKISKDLQKKLTNAQASIYHIEIVSSSQQSSSISLFRFLVNYGLFHHFD